MVPTGITPNFSWFIVIGLLGQALEGGSVSASWSSCLCKEWTSFENRRRPKWQAQTAKNLKRSPTTVTLPQNLGLMILLDTLLSGDPCSNAFRVFLGPDRNWLAPLCEMASRNCPTRLMGTGTASWSILAFLDCGTGLSGSVTMRRHTCIPLARPRISSTCYNIWFSIISC